MRPTSTQRAAFTDGHSRHETHPESASPRPDGADVHLPVVTGAAMADNEGGNPHRGAARNRPRRRRRVWLPPVRAGTARRRGFAAPAGARGNEPGPEAAGAL